MLNIRHQNERGLTDFGWLNSQHTFSFGEYRDAEQMGFGVLRVINEDRVIPKAGFETHPHSNMEIISYVVEGELAHKDSMGNGSTILPGEVQLMSAGTGITHSEFNASSEREVYFLQIWILPNVVNQPPSYQQKAFPESEQRNRFRVVISPNGEDGSLIVKQDARMLVGKFVQGVETEFAARADRRYWLQFVRGNASVNGVEAVGGDGIAITEENAINIQCSVASEIILFDLP